ncbi:p360_14L [African swine fever virus]|uniref:p360_14L n=1 Tax=African swine fever virus TaxID=10497 RepID=A0A8A1UEX9_ASF|nr:p360_14L [African swine fever virus]
MVYNYNFWMGCTILFGSFQIFCSICLYPIIYFLGFGYIYCQGRITAAKLLYYENVAQVIHICFVRNALCPIKISTPQIDAEKHVYSIIVIHTKIYAIFETTPYPISVLYGRVFFFPQASKFHHQITAVANLFFTTQLVYVKNVITIQATSYPPIQVFFMPFIQILYTLCIIMSYCQGKPKLCYYVVRRIPCQRNVCTGVRICVYSGSTYGFQEWIMSKHVISQYNSCTGFYLGHFFYNFQKTGFGYRRYASQFRAQPLYMHGRNTYMSIFRICAPIHKYTYMLKIIALHGLYYRRFKTKIILRKTLYMFIRKNLLTIVTYVYTTYIPPQTKTLQRIFILTCKIFACHNLFGQRLYRQ